MCERSVRLVVPGIPLRRPPAWRRLDTPRRKGCEQDVPVGLPLLSPDQIPCRQEALVCEVHTCHVVSGLEKRRVANPAVDVAPMPAARSGRLTKAPRQLPRPTATGRSAKCAVRAVCNLISL